MDLSNLPSSSFDSIIETFVVPDFLKQANSTEKSHLKDFIEKIVRLYLKHNLILVCLEDVIKLLNDRPNDLHKLPTGKVQIFDLFRENFPDLIDVFYFIKCGMCRNCTAVERKHKKDLKCCNCGSSLQTTETNYFVSIPIEKQIRQSIKCNWSYINKFDTSDKGSTSYSDAHDGQILKSILNQYADSDVNILSLCLNVDGANKFKSNSSSVWPIQLMQNYLPPTIRFLPQNIILAGLHYTDSDDDSKLNFRDFLLPLIKELCRLKLENIKIDIDKEKYEFKPIISHCAIDLPAKSKLQETKQFGGYDGCSFCEIHGESVLIQNLINPNKKSKKKEEKKKPKKYVRYLEESSSPKLRNEVETLEKMLAASKTGKSIDGIKSKIKIYKTNFKKLPKLKT